MSRIDPYTTTTILPPILPKKSNLLLDTYQDRSRAAENEKSHPYQHSQHLVEQSLRDLPIVIQKLAQCEITGCTFTNQNTLMQIAINCFHSINKHSAIRESHGNIELAQEKLREMNESTNSSITTMVYQEIRKLRAESIESQGVRLEDERTVSRIQRQQEYMHNAVLQELNDLEGLLLENTAHVTNIHGNERMRLRGQYIVGQTENNSILPGSLYEPNPHLDAQLQHKYATSSHLLLPFDHLGHDIETDREFKQRLNSTIFSPPQPSLSQDHSNLARATPSFQQFDQMVYDLNGHRYKHQFGDLPPSPYPNLEHTAMNKNSIADPSSSHRPRFGSIDYTVTSSAPLSVQNQRLNDQQRQLQSKHMAESVPDKFSGYSPTEYSNHGYGNSVRQFEFKTPDFNAISPHIDIPGLSENGSNVPASFSSSYSGSSHSTTNSWNRQGDYDDWDNDDDDDDDDGDYIDAQTYHTLHDAYENSSMGSGYSRSYSNFSGSR